MRVVFLMKARGQGLGCILFMWVGCCNCEEVGVFHRRDGTGLKKEYGVKASSPRVGLWGHQAT
jgi:hypothetical protein